MFKAALPAVLAVSIAFPMQAAYAQAPAPVEKSDTMLVIRPAQLLTIGVGVAGGSGGGIGISLGMGLPLGGFGSTYPSEVVVDMTAL